MYTALVPSLARHLKHQEIVAEAHVIEYTYTHTPYGHVLMNCSHLFHVIQNYLILAYSDMVNYSATCSSVKLKVDTSEAPGSPGKYCEDPSHWLPATPEESPAPSLAQT